MDEDIAIIGIGCNFPGGEGVDNFWKVLVEGRNCVVEIPNERFNKSEWFHPDESKPGKTQTSKAALIEGFNEFDHKFFGINEAEANYMDPQQKLLLQCAYRALEDAGIPLEKVSGTRTGVYIGLMNRDYETLLNNSPSTITHYNGTGTAMSIAANRISYTFNLTGPSFAIDSACSSSLVALHSACQAIRQGDCEMALCGGVSCILEPRVFVALSKAKMISPEGKSKPFCRSADGYGRGEGCGIVLLKPLKKALEDFDHIWGIVSKTAVNQDGHTVTPITKPSMSQQEDLLSMIYSSENYLANVHYIEAHGTGTPVGDPVEALSISNIIAKARPSSSGPVYIGSVKSNIGHTESAAGVAGLIKILLMMKHETIVPSVFYSADNSSIDTKALNLKIPTRAEKWPYFGSRIRMAGLNSFGFGGTNAHAIIQEHVTSAVPDIHTLQSPKLLPLSAATDKSLQMCMADTYQRISVDDTVDLQALAYTTACRRSHKRHRFRKVLAATSLSELKSLLISSRNKNLAQTKQDLKLTFVFCGNGVTYRGMCTQLLKEEPVFRDKVKEVENYFKKFRPTSILQKIANNYDNEDFSKPNVVQPLLFAIQVAIVHLLKHWGIKPDVVVGHSVGEVAAAHCSGLLSLQDAVKVIYYRSALQNKVMGGKMLVVGNIAVTDILKILPAYTGKICLAAVNSPMSCVLSGDEEAVDHVHRRFQSSFKSKNLFLHILDVPAAYHSHMMDPILGQIKDSIGYLTQHKMECELVSTVTGEKCNNQGDFVTGEYWARNIRKPVAFEQAIKSASKNKANIVFVEIAPRRALQRNIIEILGNDTTVLPSVQPDKDHETMLTTVSRLFELGVNVNWNHFYKGFETQPILFPRYQFECLKNEVYFEDVRRGNETVSHCPHPLISPSKHDSKVIKCNLSATSTSYLWEHKNNGIAIAPGALYVELAFASVMETAIPKMPLSSLQLSINFQNVFVLTKNNHPLRLMLEKDTDKTSFQIQSSNTVHASGSVVHAGGPTLIEQQTIHLNTVLKRCPSVIKSNDVYNTLNDVGFEYGATFRQLDDIHYGEEFKEAITNIRIPEEILKQLYEYCLHPVVLDYFLQMSSVLTLASSTIRPGFPSAIGSMVISAPPHKEMFMYMRLTKDLPDYFEVCGCFTDKDGHVLIELKDVRISFLGKHAHIRESCFFHNQRVAIDVEKGIFTTIKALVFEDTFGIAKGLRSCLHPKSVFVPLPDVTESSGLEVPNLRSVLSTVDMDLNEVLFIWGIQSCCNLTTQAILENLSNNCELYRQVVLSLRGYRQAWSIRVITYRSAEGTADHINTGYVFSGMTRACAAELSDISFQLIDLASVSREDVEALTHVLHSYKSYEYPEVFITKGKVYTTMITQTHITNVSRVEAKLKRFQDFALQISDPYKVTGLSALPLDSSLGAIERKSVEVQLSKICVHSSDYFPVSFSELNFGRTMYWNKYTTHNHNLLALDFSGTITAVGKDVSKLKVGDHVICCYPIKATSKVALPEAVCFKVKRLPFLKDIPCVSYIVLAWEIMQCAVPKIKQQQKKLCIFSTVNDSALVKILTLIANKSGWSVFTETEQSDIVQNAKKSHLLVILPPYDHSHLSETISVANANNIVVVCDHRQPFCFLLEVMQRDSETTCLQTLEMSQIFQKSRLKAHGALLQKWLKGMHLQRLWPSIQTYTFQIVSSESKSTEHSRSYFSARTLDLITLRSDDSTSKMSAIHSHPRLKQVFSKTGVYIVSGGLSGLGFETVKFIAHRGGGCIVTLSRSAASEKTREDMNSLHKRYGVRILNLQCDVSVSEQVMGAITVIGQHFPSCPIRGVFHSAAVLHDGLLETLDQSLFQKVLQPKVCGALNLHHATLHSPKLDYFVCYSSVSSFIGNAAQANYAAANSFLDTFCHYRRNSGLAGQSINWGPLKLGLLLNKDNFQQFLETKGLITMDVSEIHEALEHCLLANNTQQVICKFNFRNLKNHVLSQNASLKFRLSALVEEGLKNEIAEDFRIDVQSSVVDSVRRIVSEICSVDTDDISDETSLMTLGMDSMLAMTMQNRLFQETEVNVPLVAILDPNSTLSSLTALIKHSHAEDGDVDVLL